MYLMNIPHKPKFTSYFQSVKTRPSPRARLVALMTLLKGCIFNLIDSEDSSSRNLPGHLFIRFTVS